MPVLLDFSQIAISNFMTTPGVHKGTIDELLLQHMILNSIRAYKQKFGDKYGDLIICCDSRHYWRKDIFPHYKYKRKEDREKSLIDWTEVYKIVDKMKNDLRENFPYRVMEVHGAEADDVIAILAKHSKTDVMIIGSDKDYIQLHKYEHVAQYSPKSKELVVCDDPTTQLNALIITGDKSDGIPNIRSSSDCFVKGKRQSSITEKNLNSWSKLTDPKQFCDGMEMRDNYTRNKDLIDFDFIPKRIEDAILAEYEAESLRERGNKMKIMDYFAKNKMRNLLQDLNQF